MYRDFEIVGVRGREILDSRGNPTIEAEVVLENGAVGRAAVPSGASTGSHEAVELRDGDERYGGLGVRRAADQIAGPLGEAVLFENALEQSVIDGKMREADGTENKGRLGANAILGVSLAVARAAANGLRIPLYRYLGGICGRKMPVPMMNILNGGRHADNTVDLQEFMIMPWGASSFREGLRMCAEIYHTLKRVLRDRGYSTGVGDEGGFAPDLADTREALELLMCAVEQSGYRPGEDISFAIDAAASELYEASSGFYRFPGESRMSGHPVLRSAEEMVAYYEKLLGDFPVCSIEDGLWEDDWAGWKAMTKRLGNRVQLVGDDFFVTNTGRLRRGITEGAANAILVKVNQIGTLTESLEDRKSVV